MGILTDFMLQAISKATFLYSLFSLYLFYCISPLF